MLWHSYYPQMRSYFYKIFILAGLHIICATPSQAWTMYTPGDTVENVGYKPKQPIDFNHKLHTGTPETIVQLASGQETKAKGIPCEYCHSSARRSTVAGIPPVNTCWGCHQFVATDREPVKKIAQAIKNNQPIEWVKVHDLPDFVKFTHKRHVQSGLTCQECHGAVQEMTVAEQVAPLQMGVVPRLP